MEGVGFECNCVGAIRLGCTELLKSAAQHGVGEIGGEDGTRSGGTMFEKSQREIASAAADVEDGGVGIGERGTECESRTPPP